MASNDVRIKVSLDGDQQVIGGLKGIGEGAESADSKLGGLASKGLKGAGVALVGFAAASVAAGTALASGVVSAYADAQQSVGGIETLFGDSADRMKQYAADAYASAGLSANEYMSQATSFAASLTGSLNDGADAALAANNIMVAMSDNANKMGTDIGSIQAAYQGFAKQNYTMLDNLKLGYGGTQQEMQRLLDDATKLSGIKYDISSFADVSAAIQVIQKDLGIAGTTADEAMRTISGSVGMLKGSFDNLLVSMGAAGDETLSFLDVQTQVENVVTSLEAVISNIGPVISSIGSSLALIGPQLGDILSGLVSTVAGLVPDLLIAGTHLIEGLIAGVSQALPGLITAAIPALVGIVAMISTQLPLLVDAGIKAVAALASGLVEALPTLMPFVVDLILNMVDTLVASLPMLLDVSLQLITALATGLIEALPVLISAVPSIITSIVTFLVESLPIIIDAGIQLFLSLVEALPVIITGIIDAIPKIITSVIDVLVKSGPQIADAGVRLLTSIVKNIGPIISTVVSAIPGIIGALVGALSDGIPRLVSAGGDLVRGLWNGILSMGDWLMRKLSGWVDGIVGGIKGFFGIKSPSTVFRDEVGSWLPPGIGEGIERSEEAALKPLKTLTRKMVVETQEMPLLYPDEMLGSLNNKVKTGYTYPPSQGPQSYVATQVISIGDQIASAVASAIQGVTVNADVTSTISSQDMNVMADRVHSAVLGVRQSDSRAADLAIHQGIR